MKKVAGDFSSLFVSPKLLVAPPFRSGSWIPGSHGISVLSWKIFENRSRHPASSVPRLLRSQSASSS